MGSCGEVTTCEALANTALLRIHLPDLKIRFVKVVDLFKLIDRDQHLHGLTAHEHKTIFTGNVSCTFDFHSHTWLIHRLTHGRLGQRNLVVCGYKKEGNIDTPLELAIRNGTDRYSLAIDAMDRIRSLANKGAATREALLNEQIGAKNYAYYEGLEPEYTEKWVWPL
ncbi:hypothetical protein ACN47E_010344 [Coniothyrium glycines]